MDNKNKKSNNENKQEIIARIIANNDPQIKADAINNVISSNSELSEDELASKVEQEQKRLIEKSVQKQLRKEFTPQELRIRQQANDAYEKTNRYLIRIPTSHIGKEENEEKKSIFDWVKDKAEKAKEWWSNLGDSKIPKHEIVTKKEERNNFTEGMRQEVSVQQEEKENKSIEQAEREQAD